MSHVLPNLGIGIGLRPAHYSEILSKLPPIDWFEIISENYLEGGRPVEVLEEILKHYPVVLHGVSLAIGSPDPLDFTYLEALKKLVQKTQTPWVSDHLCWGRLNGAHFHDLLPLPYTREVVKYVAERAKIVQDFLEVPFALENLSSYVAFRIDEMEEWEFYKAVVEEAGIYMMLDVNNVYVSSCNHGFDPEIYLDALPLDDYVLQVHLAGHRNQGNYLLDTHDTYVCDEVWQLYKSVCTRIGGVSTLLEWDDNFISLEETWKEALKAKAFQAQCLEVAGR